MVARCAKPFWSPIVAGLEIRKVHPEAARPVSPTLGRFPGTGPGGAVPTHAARVARREAQQTSRGHGVDKDEGSRTEHGNEEISPPVRERPRIDADLVQVSGALGIVDEPLGTGAHPRSHDRRRTTIDRDAPLIPWSPAVL